MGAFEYMECDEDADCTDPNKPKCRMTDHKCVQCLTDGDCTAGCCKPDATCGICGGEQ